MFLKDEGGLCSWPGEWVMENARKRDEFFKNMAIVFIIGFVLLILEYLILILR